MAPRSGRHPRLPRRRRPLRPPAGRERPAHRSLAPPPADPGLVGHYDQVRPRAAVARAAILLAELARYVPASGERAEPAVAGFARHSLAELEGALVPASAATDAAWRGAPIALREQDHGRTGPSSAGPTISPELVASAVRLRERRLRSDVLEHVPRWVLRDVAARTGNDRPCLDDPASLAKTYGDIAVDLDRRGLTADDLAADVLAQTTRALALPPPYAASLTPGPAPASEWGLHL